MTKQELINNFLRISSEKCKLFIIGKDNNWYVKGLTYSHIPLKDWPEEHLYDMFDNILDNVTNYNTINNIKVIKKELKNKEY